MLTISNNKLRNSSHLPKVITCKKCKKQHVIKCGNDKMGKEDSLIQFYKCGNEIYLAGLGWKDIRKP